MLPTGRANGKTMTGMSRPSTASTLGCLVLIVALMVATPVAAADEDPSAQLNDGSSETSVVDGEPSGEGSCRLGIGNAPHPTLTKRRDYKDDSNAYHFGIVNL